MAQDGREGGYIKLYRRIESWPLYAAMTGEQRLVVFALLLGANWKASAAWLGNLRVEVGRGEWLVSEETLARRAKVSRKVVRAALAKMMAEGFLSSREVGQRVGSEWAASGTEKGPEMGPRMGPAARVLIVNNFERYQVNDGEEGPEMGPEVGQERASLGPAKGQPRAPSKEGEEGEEGKPASKRLTALTEAMVSVFLTARGSKYLHGGAKDATSLKRLMSAADDPEILRRWRVSLSTEDKFHRCDSFAQLAMPAHWNHFAAVSGIQTKMRVLGAPGGA